MTANPNPTPSAEETAARVLMTNWRHNEGSHLLRMSGEDIQTLNRAIASALSDTRRKALEEAARAVCKRCRAGEPVCYAEEAGDPSAGMWWHRLTEGADIACVAMHVRRLLKTEGE